MLKEANILVQNQTIALLPLTCKTKPSSHTLNHPKLKWAGGGIDLLALLPRQVHMTLPNFPFVICALVYFPSLVLIMFKMLGETIGMIFIIFVLRALWISNLQKYLFWTSKVDNKPDVSTSNYLSCMNHFIQVYHSLNSSQVII